MEKLEQAVKDIHVTDSAGGGYGEDGKIHPLAHLLVTIFYIFAVLSFDKYNIIGLAGMVLYVIIQCIWHELSVMDMIKRIWPVFCLTALIGIANPLFDKAVYGTVGNFTVTYGMLSMVTLIIKGVLCVMASYILVIQTGIRQICYSLQLMHLPKEIVTVLLLMHRYLIVLLKELNRMQQAYKLRAPRQKGLHIRVWGSFVGLFLLRSIDRAGEVYESMKLRGFNGKIQYFSGNNSYILSVTYVFLWGIAIITFRILLVFQMVGNLL